MTATEPDSPLDAALLCNDGWIAGAAVPGAQRFTVRDPASGAAITAVADLDAAAAAAAVDAANQALPGWRATSVAERVSRIERWAEQIDQHAVELARIVTLEAGKPVAQAQGEIRQCAALLRWFASCSNQLDTIGAAAGTADQEHYSIRQAVGVVACITPWNFPAAAVIVKAGAALLAGCTTVIKPSEETPLIALALARLATTAGIPDGGINIVPCQEPQAVGATLCNDTRVRMLSFTGSIATGQHLYAACGATVKRLALELGGNAPFIVFADADLERAVDGAMAARFYNSGQICVGANRYYIEAPIHDAFAARLAERVRALKVGSGSDPASEIGPLINRAAVDRLNGLIANAVAAGATILAGGEQSDPATQFFAPTVIAGMQPGMAAHAQEIFGPVACLYRFDNEQEVLQAANSTEAGLSAYVYTADATRLERFITALEAGVVGANTAAIFANDLPFGGIKQSGIGREHGPHCLDEYLEVKSVCRRSS